jgi:hypothetical protein
MKEHNLLAPRRPVQRDAHPHDGTIVTERVDQVCASWIRKNTPAS